MKEILLRIKELYTAKGMTCRAFAIAIGFSYSSLNNYLLGKRSIIDAELIRRVLSSFDDISAEWLVRGEGCMIKGTPLDSDKLNEERVSKLVDTIAFQQGTITSQAAKIRKLEAELAMLKQNNIV